MITPAQLPTGARTMMYVAHGKRGRIDWWPTDRGMWQWQALGNCGEEETERAALEVAKRWIRDRQ